MCNNNYYYYNVESLEIHCFTSMKFLENNYKSVVSTILIVVVLTVKLPIPDAVVKIM